MHACGSSSAWADKIGGAERPPDGGQDRERRFALALMGMADPHSFPSRYNLRAVRRIYGDGLERQVFTSDEG